MLSVGNVAAAILEKCLLGNTGTLCLLRCFECFPFQQCLSVPRACVATVK